MNSLTPLKPMPIDEVRRMTIYAKSMRCYEDAKPYEEFLKDRHRGIYDPEVFAEIDSIRKHFKEEYNQMMKGYMQAYIERLVASGEMTLPNDDKMLSKRIFHDNLDEQKIVVELVKVNRGKCGERQFCHIVKEFFTSIGWLTDRKDTHFVDWMKRNGIVTTKSKGLKNIEMNDEMETIKTHLKSVFQFHNQKGVWEDKDGFYLPNRWKINKEV